MEKYMQNFNDAGEEMNGDIEEEEGIEDMELGDMDINHQNVGNGNNDIDELENI